MSGLNKGKGSRLKANRGGRYWLGKGDSCSAIRKSDLSISLALVNYFLYCVDFSSVVLETLISNQDWWSPFRIHIHITGKKMNHNKRRPFKIEPFQHKVDVDPKYVDRTWKILEHAIEEIYNHNTSSLSFEELYRSPFLSLFLISLHFQHIRLGIGLLVTTGNYIISLWFFLNIYNFYMHCILLFVNL